VSNLTPDKLAIREVVERLYVERIAWLEGSEKPGEAL